VNAKRRGRWCVQQGGHCLEVKNCRRGTDEMAKSTRKTNRRKGDSCVVKLADEKNKHEVGQKGKKEKGVQTKLRPNPL